MAARLKSKGYYQEGVASLEHDQQKAFVSFQKAVKLNPSNKEARYGLGHILAQQGKLLQAEEEFRSATRLDENYSEAYTYLGQVLEKQGRWPEAVAAFLESDDVAIRFCPQSAFTWDQRETEANIALRATAGALPLVTTDARR